MWGLTAWPQSNSCYGVLKRLENAMISLYWVYKTMLQKLFSLEHPPWSDPQCWQRFCPEDIFFRCLLLVNTIYFLRNLNQHETYFTKTIYSMQKTHVPCNLPKVSTKNENLNWPNYFVLHHIWCGPGHGIGKINYLDET